MARIIYGDSPINTCGQLPQNGMVAPEFVLVKPNFEEISLSALTGKTVALYTYLSIDYPICSFSIFELNERAKAWDDVVTICVSSDSPFSLARAMEKNPLENIILASECRYPIFGDIYGVRMVDGAYAGLLSRTLLLIDKDGIVRYSEQTLDLCDEPDYKGIERTLGEITGKKSTSGETATRLFA